MDARLSVLDGLSSGETDFVRGTASSLAEQADILPRWVIAAKEFANNNCLWEYARLLI
jgi:hypothetical protein